MIGKECKAIKNRIMRAGFLRNIAFLILCIAFILPSCEIVSAAEIRTVKVGVLKMDGFYMLDDEGHKSGYGYDFLQMVSRYENLNFEYVGYGKSWPELLEMLECGDVDLLINAQKNAEREEQFAFTDEAIGTTVAVLCIREDDNRFIPGDYSTYSGKRMGMMLDNNHNQAFREYAKVCGFDYDTFFYNSFEQLYKALHDGTIDAAISSDMARSDGVSVLDSFSSSDLFGMMRKDDKELLTKLNNAIRMMDYYEHGWRLKLQEAYYSNEDSVVLTFDEEEKAILEEYSYGDRHLRVMCNPDRRPYSWFEDGTAVGIIPDIFRDIADELEIDYEIIEPDDREHYRELLESGTIDVILDLKTEDSEAEELGYVQTKGYLTVPLVKITRRNFSGAVKKVIGVAHSEFVEENMKMYCPEAEMLFCDTVWEAVEAVREEAADATFCFEHIGEYLVSEDITNSLILNTVKGSESTFGFAVRSDINHKLVSALSKCISGYSSDKYKETVIRYTEQVNTDTSIKWFIYNNPEVALMAGVVLSLAVGLAIILLVMLWHFRRNKRTQRFLEKQQQLLELAVSKAEHANNAKSEFLSNMSHDIRTPMNAIVGYSELLEKEGTDPEKVARYASKIKVSGQLLLDLVGDILDMSKIESGKTTLNMTDFSFSKLISELTSVIQYMIQDKELSFSVSCADITEDYYHGDVVRLKQILMNILSNAIKYSRNNGSIDLSIQRVPDASVNYVHFRFVISDNGIGMKEEFIERLFNPFEREESALTGKTHGTGLGMAITKNLVELMGGTIDVESRQGEGTRFYVHLKLRKAEEKKTPVINEEEENEIKSDACEKELKGTRVLIVEDNELNAEIIMELLGALGIICEWADNGRSGVDKFFASEPGYYEMIIMDVQMPVMDGYTATRTIRNSDRTDAKTIPIVAMTANAFLEDVNESVAAGMNAHLSKPVNFESLMKTMRNLLTPAGKAP